MAIVMISCKTKYHHTYSVVQQIKMGTQIFTSMTLASLSSDCNSIAGIVNSYPDMPQCNPLANVRNQTDKIFLTDLQLQLCLNIIIKSHTPSQTHHPYHYALQTCLTTQAGRTNNGLPRATRIMSGLSCSAASVNGGLYT